MVTRMQTVKTMVLMVIIYALCWLPLHCVTVVGDLKPSIWNLEHIQLVWIACHWLAVSSCCWNPIVYYWTNDTLRDGFKHALGTWCPCLGRPSAPPTTCHRHVVYQSTLRAHGSDVRADGELRHPTAYVRVSPVRWYYRAHGTNQDRSNNVELRQLRARTSEGYSTLSSPVVRAATRSY